MSTSSKPRVVRKHKIRKHFSRWNYRAAIDRLLEDFDNRCAYSLVHVKQVGKSAIHVDHHNPKLKRKSPYANLFPAFSVCNQSKGDTWPDPQAGVRFLNPCVETEYGTEIFEDPNTHELIGTTDNARYHILMLDLNNETLVHQRAERSILLGLFHQPAICNPSSPARDGAAAIVGTKVMEILRTKIPEIPPPPSGRIDQEIV